MKNAWAGGPDYDISEQVQSVWPAGTDAFDQVYLTLREVFPGWMVLGFIIVGALVVGILIFKKQVKALIALLNRIINSE